MHSRLAFTITAVILIAGCAGAGTQTPTATPTPTATSTPTETSTPTATPTPTPADSDGDGLTDQREQEIGTDPTKADTDGDGLDDGVEIDIGTDPLKKDTDGDGISDRREQTQGSDPTKMDTDGDGLDDQSDVCPTVDAEVTLQVTFISATDDADGWFDRADPYVKFDINGERKESDFFEDPGEVTEPFALTMDVPDDQDEVEVRVSLWDEDSHWEPSKTDDQLDINDAGPDVLAWSGNYSVSSGDTLQVQTEGGGDSPDDYDGNIEFQIQSNC